MKKPLVAVIMGSESDMPVMEKASETLTELGIEHICTVSSAHRSPGWLAELLAECESKGVKIYIAGAGGAAHLAGTIAGKTVKPVIGVPLFSKLSGLDSLLSTMQMPSGVPVATVAIDGAVNAALLAAQMLALSDKHLEKVLTEKRRTAEKSIREKAKKNADI